MRKVLEITFAGERFRTVLSDSAPDALAKLRSEAPAVALVDAGLDGTDGYTVCKQIKQAAPGVGVIVLSSKQQPYDRVRGSAAGADDFIDKPFDTQQLIDKVEALAKARSAGAVAQKPVIAIPIPMPAARPLPVATAEPRWSPSDEPAPELEIVEDDELIESDIGDYEAPSVQPAVQPGGRRMPMPAAAAPAQAPAARPPVPAAAAAARAGSAAIASHGGLEQKLSALGLTRDQVQGVLALSREVLEQVVWEVVPTLAETLIKEEISRLTRE